MNALLIKFFESIGFTACNPADCKITSPIEEGERELGPMNDLEKTCYVFLQQWKTKHKELHQKMDATDDPEQLEKLAHEHYVLMEAKKCVDAMMWASVGQRFGNIEKSKGFGFREGNKVVALPERTEEERFAEVLASFIFGGR